MNLIIQPDDGLTPLLQAVKRQDEDRHPHLPVRPPELEKALEAAVARGVVVRALIAHTNRGGEKTLRKLEMRMLEAGVIVARTADDLLRYHGKMMIVDDDALRVRFQLHQARHRARAAASASSPRIKKLVKEAPRCSRPTARARPTCPVTIGWS